MRGSAELALAGARPGIRIDLGTEAPLTVGFANAGAPARKSISVRWLSGTILTGLTSFILMGGALTVALNGQNLIATPAESADPSLIAVHLTTGEKGDRILPTPAPPTAREIIPVAVTVREGDRELIIQRPYVHINAALAAAPADGVDIPAYDPVAIVGEAANAAPPEEQLAAAGGFAEGDVNGGNAAVRTTEFPFDALFGETPAIGVEEVEQIVLGNADLFAYGEQTVFGVLAYANTPGFGLEEALSDPFAAPGIRAIPENVDYLTKTTGDGISRNERVIAFETDVPLADLLGRASLAATDIDAALSVMGQLIDIATLSTNHRLRVAFTTLAGGEPELMRLSIYENEVHQATVARNDANVFVRADAPLPLPDTYDTAPTRTAAGALPSLYEALYRTALEQQMPTEQIAELISIFAFDLDLQARIAPSDTVELFQGLASEEGTDPPILFASVTSAGATTTYYRFQTDDGVIKYYNADGYSADNFLLRKPMSGGELRSRFGNRLHPVLGVYRMHAGVDWSAPRGTPIVAAGDGVIVRMEYNSGGYGYFTIIRHELGYETAYAHQSAFAAGLEVGDTVHQGQVIGFVGSTGLSTGPHLHYEVRINGQPVNPLTVRLPEGRVLDGDELVAFQAQRDQINQLIGIGTEIAATR